MKPPTLETLSKTVLHENSNQEAWDMNDSPMQTGRHHELTEILSKVGKILGDQATSHPLPQNSPASLLSLHQIQSIIGSS